MSSSKENFLHFIAAEIEESYGITIPEHTEKKEIVYRLSSFLFGTYQKKLFVYFVSGRPIDYRVHYFIFGLKMS